MRAGNESERKRKAAEYFRVWYAANSERLSEYQRKRRTAKYEALATRPRPEVCESCGNPPEEGKVLHFDHCHVVGTFRGWLCRGCNHALGHLKNNPERIRKLLAYCEKYDI